MGGVCYLHEIKVCRVRHISWDLDIAPADQPFLSVRCAEAHQSIGMALSGLVCKAV